MQNDYKLPEQSVSKVESQLELRFKQLTSPLFVAILTVVCIGAYLIGIIAPANYSFFNSNWLLCALVYGGGILLIKLTKNLLRFEFSSDLLAGLSIITALFLGEYLAGTIIVLMLSGGETLEQIALNRASSVLKALAHRMPVTSHRREGDKIVDIAVEQINIGDPIVIFPFECCPVDGTVIEGEGTMDESFLTGEPFKLRKTIGATVISGAVNGETALTISATKKSSDSRYAKIVTIIKQAELSRPQVRRLGDRLGALYTPLAITIAILAWVFSGDSTRFLAVLVLATPCPLLIAIPVAIIGAISLAARRGIIIKNAAVFENLTACRSVLFDKTGTLTYGQPELTNIDTTESISSSEIIKLVASLERYSRHPLSTPILNMAENLKIELVPAERVSELPGRGLVGNVAGRIIEVTSRKKLLKNSPDAQSLLPAQTSGLECLILLDGKYAATFHFRDKPRADSKSFIKHLKERHKVENVLLISGDRESEVKYLADLVGITEAYYSQSPEDKVALVKRENQQGKTLFIGDGINDAPALLAASVGVAMGDNSEVVEAAADAVILEPDLVKLDELLHIGKRMYQVAIVSASGGIALSLVGMLFAATGYIAPVSGALIQELIDLAAILNALRAAIPPRALTDF